MFNGNILVVDDQKTQAEMSIHSISQFANQDNIFYASCAEETIKLIKEKQIDLIFLDIDMPTTSGYSIAEYLDKNNQEIPYVFLTGYANFAAKSYDYEPLDFLTKPIDIVRLSKTFERLERRENKVDLGKIAIETDAGFILLNPDDVLYIVKENRKIQVHCKEERYNVNYSMDELELILEDYGFFRNHQSYLVPLNEIVSVKPSLFGNTYEAQLSNGSKVPVSRYKYTKLKELLTNKGVKFL